MYNIYNIGIADYPRRRDDVTMSRIDTYKQEFFGCLKKLVYTVCFGVKVLAIIICVIAYEPGGGSQGWTIYVIHAYLIQLIQMIVYFFIVYNIRHMYYFNYVIPRNNLDKDRLVF